MTKIMINNVLRDMTPEEETQRATDVAKSKELSDAEKLQIKNTITKKASGKQKLLDLGLSEEEVKALIGI
tara:strand:+ start:174 stop:383 length:210 start_codon:yes stop_codon:yes gene_type:complete